MTGTKHTAGPWVLELQEVRPHRIIIRAGDKEILTQDMYAHSSVQRTLADCLAAIGFPASERPSIIAALQEQIANARLWAAAPDLLKALVRIAGGWGYDEIPEDADGEFAAALQATAQEAIDALTNAAGPPTGSREP